MLGDAEVVQNCCGMVAGLLNIIRKWSEVLRHWMMWHGCSDKRCVDGV